jgi:hypothetical protein
MHFAILIYDEPDSAALRDQYRQAHKDINLHRWRFGRVMDRFK